jgi:hypothetical protein
MLNQYPKLESGRAVKTSPKNSTLQFLLAYSSSIEVKKKGSKKVLIHLN